MNQVDARSSINTKKQPDLVGYRMSKEKEEFPILERKVDDLESEEVPESWRSDRAG
jgi:hypothetical protein